MNGATIDSLQRGVSWDKTLLGSSGEVVLFRLTKTRFLILTNSTKESGAFERLGIVFCDDEKSIPDVVRKGEQTEMEII
jgi:hypothetical protein